MQISPLLPDMAVNQKFNHYNVVYALKEESTFLQCLFCEGKGLAVCSNGCRGVQVPVNSGTPSPNFYHLPWLYTDIAPVLPIVLGEVQDFSFAWQICSSTQNHSLACLPCVFWAYRNFDS